MRWKITLRYLGTPFTGWQRQNEAGSVQQFIEEAFSTILRQQVAIVGCGRTDTGVHASHYVAHADFEFDGDLQKVIYQINAILPKEISIHSIEIADPQFHARFDALARRYSYQLHFEKNPFVNGQSFYFAQASLLNWEKMQEVADIIHRSTSFKPFCKSDSGVAHFECHIIQAEWKHNSEGAIFTIEANRFLRGMVRLIVGACLQAGLNKIEPKDVEECLQQQSSLPMAWSVPAEGLFLDRITYP